MIQVYRIYKEILLERLPGENYSADLHFDPMHQSFSQCPSWGFNSIKSTCKRPCLLGSVSAPFSQGVGTSSFVPSVESVSGRDRFNDSKPCKGLPLGKETSDGSFNHIIKNLENTKIQTRPVVRMHDHCESVRDRHSLVQAHVLATSLEPSRKMINIDDILLLRNFSVSPTNTLLYLQCVLLMYSESVLLQIVKMLNTQRYCMIEPSGIIAPFVRERRTVDSHSDSGGSSNSHSDSGGSSISQVVDVHHDNSQPQTTVASTSQSIRPPRELLEIHTKDPLNMRDNPKQVIQKLIQIFEWIYSVGDTLQKRCKQRELQLWSNYTDLQTVDQENKKLLPSSYYGFCGLGFRCPNYYGSSGSSRCDADRTEQRRLERRRSDTDHSTSSTIGTGRCAGYHYPHNLFVKDIHSFLYFLRSLLSSFHLYRWTYLLKHSSEICKHMTTLLHVSTRMAGEIAQFDLIAMERSRGSPPSTSPTQTTASGVATSVHLLRSESATSVHLSQRESATVTLPTQAKEQE